jgi:hypothetical protein
MPSIVAHRSLSLVLVFIAVSLAAHGTGRDDTDAAITRIGAGLTGRYDNSAQVTAGKAMKPPPQHVTITIEATPQPDWQLWRVHMDVDPDVAQLAGSDTSLDAIWAMNVSRRGAQKVLELIPYTLKPAVDEASIKASAFDQTQWLSLEACALAGDLSKPHIIAQAPADEMCVAETMGLGGKRAFLPSWIEHNGDWLRVQLVYFGKPWRVDAHRLAD